MHIQSRRGARVYPYPIRRASRSARVFGGSERLNRKQCTPGSGRLKENKRVRPGCSAAVALDHSSGPNTSARVSSDMRGTDVLAAKGA